MPTGALTPALPLLDAAPATPPSATAAAAAGAAPTPPATALLLLLLLLLLASYSAPSLSSSIQLASTTARTRLLYSRRSRSYSCDASALAGDAGLGSLRSDWTERKKRGGQVMTYQAGEREPKHHSLEVRMAAMS